MLAVISPAKSLDYETPVPLADRTEIRFPDQTEALVMPLSRMSRAKLGEIMPVSDKLVELNRQRYRDFWDQDERAAIFAYNGDVYTGFEARSLDEPALRFAQDHLRILSGLYGLLRPLDAIRPHRLEMGTKWAPRRKKLTDFWADRIADRLAQDVSESGASAVVNLASQEYWATVAPYTSRLGVPVIDVDFRQQGPDGPRFNSFAAKQARGMMARYICDNHLTDPEALEGFDSDGYRLVDKADKENGVTLHFARE